MIGSAGPRPVPSGLAARIIGFLSITLIPLGVVAYLQTSELNRETRIRTELSLVTLTDAAASGERETILRALGNAEAIGASTDLAEELRDQCTARLRTFINANSVYSFVGFLPRSGLVTCSSVGRPLDLRRVPNFERRMEAPRAMVSRNDSPAISETPVLIVSEPYFRKGEFSGYVTLSLPTSGLRQEGTLPLDQDLTELLTFNHLGQVLSSRSPVSESQRLLPETVNLSELVDVQAHSFRARSVDGQERIFAVTPLVSGLVYAISIWPLDSRAATAVEVNWMTQALPLVMWAASVIVAFLAINRLVIRHIRTLGQQMRAFARTRRVPQGAVTGDMALELRDMESDFLHMADAILQDEAQLENALREKTILLKEVHHRVKNNLQLISSIMNMQIRQSDETETRQVLRRLQDRIRSLATIHRNLYLTEDLGHVDAGRLLDDLIRQMALAGDDGEGETTVDLDLEHIEVYPDQAVPLSLLTAEALTNASTYMAPDGSGRQRLAVRFRKLAEREAEIVIENTCGGESDPTHGEPGLGNRLIRAFATQLGGELTQEVSEGLYRVRVQFQLSDFKPEVVDY
ncbi:sensor histidine kinase [Thalassococcus profundi]|uniref:histidine kinase n=1 Tax=Thalassococcus profundi TaxID=2282382 RepID=A0A369TQI2_9RHOB|nr:sensor histidine kinase [Thalassococcus profundi]